MENNTQELDLSPLGLTSNEAKAYESLIMLGKASAAEISKHSKIPYGRIYTVLDSLESKGLLRLIPESPKKYQPTSPEELEKFVETKKTELNNIQEKLKTYKSIYLEHGAEAVQVAFGKHNFYKLASQMVKSKKYSYSVKYNFDMHSAFVREVSEYRKQKIDHKTLGRIDSETKENVLKWKKIDPEVKAIPNEGVAISLQDDNELLIAMIKSNTTLLIRDQSFIKLMKELFVCYYDNH